MVTRDGYPYSGAKRWTYVNLNHKLNFACDSRVIFSKCVFAVRKICSACKNVISRIVSRWQTPVDIEYVATTFGLWPTTKYRETTGQASLAFQQLQSSEYLSSEEQVIGHLIAKCIFGVFNFLQKTNENKLP